MSGTRMADDFFEEQQTKARDNPMCTLETPPNSMEERETYYRELNQGRQTMCINNNLYFMRGGKKCLILIRALHHNAITNPLRAMAVLWRTLAGDMEDATLYHFVYARTHCGQSTHP
jgi:hypothetical protein